MRKCGKKRAVIVRKDRDTAHKVLAGSIAARGEHLADLPPCQREADSDGKEGGQRDKVGDSLQGHAAALEGGEYPAIQSLIRATVLSRTSRPDRSCGTRFLSFSAEIPN